MHRAPAEGPALPVPGASFASDAMGKRVTAAKAAAAEEEAAEAEDDQKRGADTETFQMSAPRKTVIANKNAGTVMARSRITSCVCYHFPFESVVCVCFQDLV